MNEQEFVQKLREALDDDEVTSEHFDVTDAWDIEVRTFEEAGLITNNVGAVVAFPNGDEFQVQVVQSEQGAKEETDDEEGDDELAEPSDSELEEAYDTHVDLARNPEALAEYRARAKEAT